jgi:two-component system response regulator HydG
LILGESGTGKEIVANAIHRSSERAGRPLIKVNCAALPETLLESELFGYERGAFTGAVSRKEGRFFLADEGMLFLDEIGDMPMALQAKILRVLQEGEFERLGGNETLKVDVRIVAASNQDLTEAIAERCFREDLYYRLNVIGIHLVPLRERRGDIPLLVEHFLERFSAKNNQPVNVFSRAAVEAMSNYDWPGNIRELENSVERAVVLGRGEVLTLADLPAGVAGESREDDELPVEAGSTVISIPVGTPLAEVERRVILETLRSTGGDKSAAARRLGIATRTIYRKLDQAEQLKS